MHLIPVNEKNERQFRGLLFEPMSKGDGRRLRLGFMDENEPLGAAVLDETDEIVRLESIFIAPDRRRQGCGSAFIKELLEACAAKGSLFLTVDFPYSREDLRSFFLACGFVLTGDSVIYSFRPIRTVQNKKAAEILFKDRKGRAKSFYALSADETASVRSFLLKQGYSDGIIHKSSFARDLSSCVFGKDGKVLSLMLVTRYGDDIVVEFTTSTGESNTAVLLTFRHMLECFEKMDKEGNLTEDIRVIFQAARESVVDTALKLFEGYLESDDFLVSGFMETEGW